MSESKGESFEEPGGETISTCEHAKNPWMWLNDSFWVI